MSRSGQGCADGLHSLRGPVTLEHDADVSPPRGHAAGVQRVGAAAGRALLLCGPRLAHAALLALASVLRRADHLRPALSLARVQLPDTTAPHIVTVSTYYLFFFATSFAIIKKNSLFRFYFIFTDKNYPALSNCKKLAILII